MKHRVELAHRISELFAFVVTDPQCGEGILRREAKGPLAIATQPMIADSMERLELFRAEAFNAARAMDLPLGIARFVRAE